MIFIRSGIHMVAIKDGSVINIQPNPKFVRNNIQYGAIMLNETSIGVYPLTEIEDNVNLKTVYDVFDSIIRQIESDTKIITLPTGYKFNSIEEIEEFKTSLKDYSKSEMIDIYYKSLLHVK